ncbi:MAG: hypothetical protein CMK07_12510, partial [Ponticaulis sp.]|nr:hypothetical protein [Ponticaulis sp.]
MIRDYYVADGIYVGDDENDMIFAVPGVSVNSEPYPDNSYIYGDGGFDILFGDHSGYWLSSDAGATIATALNIDGANWSLGENPDITLAETVPHTTIAGHGNGSLLYYAVTAGSNETLTVDIDWGFGSIGGGSFDSYIEIRDAGGNLIASNDDAPISQGGGGSVYSLDSYYSFTTPASGQYYIVVGQSSGSGIAPISSTRSFILNISLTGHEVNAEQPTGDDELFGGDGDNVLYGMGGDDRLTGGSGFDVIDGGSGTDTISYESATSSVTVDLALTTAQDTGGGGTDTLANIENIVGSDYTDTLYGTDGDNRFLSSTGSDDYYGRGGADRLSYFTDDGDFTGTFDGGSGDDTLSIFGNAETLNLEGSTLSSVETLEISTGENRSYTLSFRDPTFVFDNVTTTSERASEQLTLRITSRTGTVDLSDVSFSGWTSNDEIIILDSVYDDYLTGTSQNDTIFTGIGSDAVWGMGGDDVIRFFQNGTVPRTGHFDGGEGNDTLSYESETDAYIVNLITNRFLYASSDVIASLVSIENINAGSGHDILIGSDGDNTIHGNGGDDIIGGGGGTDRIEGGGGDDVIRYDTADGAPLSYFDGGSHNDTLVLFGSETDVDLTLADIRNIETLAFELGTTESYSATLNAGQFDFQTIQLNNAQASDQITLNLLLNGTMSDFTSVSFADFSANEIINIIGGAENDFVTGTTRGDNISLGDGNDIAFGWSGDDTINGGVGDDLIDGGAGTDTLTGGTGRDSFIMNMFQMVNDVITDLEIGEIIMTDYSEFIGTSAFSANGTSQIKYYTTGTDTIFLGDADGDGSVDEGFIVNGVLNFAGTAAEIIALSPSIRDFDQSGMSDLLFQMPGAGSFFRLDDPASGALPSNEARPDSTSLGFADIDGDGILDHIMKGANRAHIVQFGADNDTSQNIGRGNSMIAGFADIDGDGEAEAFAQS